MADRVLQHFRDQAKGYLEPTNGFCYLNPRKTTNKRELKPVQHVSSAAVATAIASEKVMKKKKSIRAKKNGHIF